MTAPLSVKTNNYFENEKDSVVNTPPEVCEFLRDLIAENHLIHGTIVDPSIGSGNLVTPFRRTYKDIRIIGYDIRDVDNCADDFRRYSFLAEKEKRTDVSLVICNPPFNLDAENKSYIKGLKLGKALLPEVFMQKVFELYGMDVPLILIVPMGFRLNQRVRSKRWRKMRDVYPKITSIISLPLDVFENVEFHAEILIWNLPQLDAHYYLSEEYLPKHKRKEKKERKNIEQTLF